MPQDATDAVPVLSAATATAVVERAAALGSAGVPLPTGLRAAAGEADSWRLARALNNVAAELDRGRSLDDLLAASQHRLPPHLAGLMRVAQQSGDFGPMLAAWLENRRAAREHWRTVIAALSYPALAVVFAVTVFLFFSVFIVGTFRHMYDEFGLKLPMMTTHFLWLCDVGMYVIPLCAAIGLGTAVCVRLFGGRAGWSLLMTNLPLVGPNWHWTGVAEMLRCLSLLVERRMALPEALRLTADGIADAYVGSQCRRLADRTEGGTSLTMSLVHLRTLPLSIVPLVRWGEERGLLPECLRSAAEMLEGRLSLRTDALVQILPPIIFMLVGVLVGSGVLAIFLPLISLIQGLS
jgi:type II secretory pathway component PulF